MIPRGMRSSSVGSDMSLQLNTYQVPGTVLAWEWKVSRHRISATKDAKARPTEAQEGQPATTKAMGVEYRVAQP